MSKLKKIGKKKRPWDPPKVDKNKLPGQGRRVVNPFYHTNLWRKTSEAYAREHPLCEEHEELGRTVPGKVTDHIRPINPVDAFDTQDGRYGEPLDFDNMQRLCLSCHARKSGSEAHKKQ